MKKNLPQIYLHIGLPKTATTSLQSGFFALSIHVDYVGVHQPRNKTQNSLYQILLHLIESTDDDYKINKSRVIHEIGSRVSKTTLPLLISEEGFTVNSPHVGWQKKIERLSDVLSSFEVIVLVTVREPISAAHSLYIELYNQISSNYRTFERFFKDSNQAKIYQYDYLHDVVSQCFKKSTIRYLAFEKIIASSTARDFFAELISPDQNFNLNLANTNQKTEGQGGKYSTPRSLADILQKIIGLARLIKLNKISRIRPIAIILNLILAKLSNITLAKRGVLIPNIDSDTMVAMKQALQENNHKFAQVSGIDYNR